MTDIYEFHIAEHLEDHWDDWFAGFSIRHDHDGSTILSGGVKDQPALYGLLLRVNQLGLCLLRVEKMNRKENHHE